MRKGVFLLVALFSILSSYGQKVLPTGPNEICEGKSITLSVDPGTAVPTSYQWLKDGIPIPGATKSTFSATESGLYSVVLDPDKPTEVTVGPEQVNSNPVPVADFTSDFVANTCGNNPVTFKDLSTNGSIYAWDFGDPGSFGNNKSLEQNPVHRFVGAGGVNTENFTITLTVTSAKGGCKSSKKMTITARQSPDATLGGTGYSMFEDHPGFKSCGNLTEDNFTFTNNSKTKATNKNYRIEWGDGSPDFTSVDFENPISHRYTSGRFTLKYTIEGENGCDITREYYVFIGTNPEGGLINKGTKAICSGTPLEFPIEGYENNTNGTVYTVEFNDGSPIQKYEHPNVPKSIWHTFLKTSCGTTSGEFPNAYFAKLRIANPCDVVVSNVYPIYVSEKPKPDFSITPGSVVCPNTRVKVTNITIGNSVDNGVCSEGNAVWFIEAVTGSPTGWTVVKGDLGSDEGSDIPTRWLVGSQSLEIDFTAVGTYKIRMRTGNTNCGIDEVTNIICVNPPPTASFSLDKSEGCGPFVVKTNSTANTPNCGKNAYTWTVEYSPPAGCTDVTGSYEYQEGTNASSANPVFRFINAGTYTIGLVVSNSGGVCTTPIMKQTVVVKGQPVAEIGGISSPICGSTAIEPTALIKCFRDDLTKVNWLFPGGTPVNSNLENPGKVTYPNPGDYLITMNVNNECGTAVYTMPIKVNQVPDVTSSSFKNPDRCDNYNGEIYLNGLAKSSSFNVSYTFKGQTENLVLNSDGNGRVTIPNLEPGVYSQIILEAGDCSSKPMGPFTLTRPATPAPDFALSPDNGCGPLTVHFTNNTTNLNSFKYNWDFGNQVTSTAAQPKDVLFSASSFGVDTTYQVKLSAFYPTCDTVEFKRNVTVKPRPNPIFTPSSSQGCSPMEVTFTNVSRGTTTKYVWDFGDGQTLETTNADQVKHTFVTQTEKIFPVTLTAENSCGKQSFTLDLKVSPNNINLNLGVSGPDRQGCAPHQVTFVNNSAGASTFVWDFGDGSKQTTSLNQDQITHTYTKPGTYNITVNASNSCASNAITESITVYESPSAAFSADKYTACPNIDIKFANESKSATSYNWDFGDGTTSDEADPTHKYKEPGYYKVILTAMRVNGPGKVCSQTYERTVEISGPIVSISGSNDNCTNVPMRFGSDVNSATPITAMVWELSNGASGTGKYFDYTFLQPGKYTLKFTATTSLGCSSSTSTEFTINPSPNLKASNDVVICLGKSTSLNVSGANSYSWSPASDLSCSTCPNPVASPQVSTPYVVTGTNGFGCTSVETVLVTVAQPFTLTTSGNTAVCAGESVTLRAGGASSYLWSPSTGLSSNNVADPVASPIAKTVYTVIGYDENNCFSSSATITVDVGDIPTVELGPDLTVPAGTEMKLAVKTNSVPIKSFLWTPQDNLDCPTCPEPNAIIKRDVTYKLTATTDKGCVGTDQVNIKVICENTQVFIPNAFTPDGDGLNDILMVRGKGIAKVRSFRIYNRLGELVFDRSDFPANEPAYGWDGTVRGKKSGPAVFVYTAEVVCGNGQTFFYKGNTSILK